MQRGVGLYQQRPVLEDHYVFIVVPLATSNKVALNEKIIQQPASIQYISLYRGKMNIVLSTSQDKEELYFRLHSKYTRKQMVGIPV